MTSSQLLAIFFAVLLGFANTSQASSEHVHGNYFEDRFMARAFGFKRSLKQDDPKIVKVDDFGANVTDSTEAFGRAWSEACSLEGSVSLVVPRNTYLLKPITFKGPCKSYQIRVQVLGTVRASTEISDYGDDNPRDWIVFDGVQNLTVEGVSGGIINGWGGVWWNRSCTVNNTQPCPLAPTAVTYNKCDNLVVRNMRSLNPQGAHISILGCNNVTVSGLIVTALANSPNTDGINVRETTNLTVSDSVVATGADCIALNNGTSNVRVSGITCGPGHGISIGSQSLAGNVYDVTVDGAVFSGTTSGLTIKTSPGGSGNVKHIKFMNIVMENVQIPILIDQEQNSEVQVEDVLYQNITGTSASPVAVNFDCNNRFKCREIVLQDLDLHGNNNNVHASCKSVEFTKIGTVAPLCPNNPDNVTRSTNTPSQPPVTQPVDHRSISVDDFGAKGNGKDYDNDAFERAWQYVCSSNEETFLVVPKKTYLLRPIRFIGQCKSKVTIQILGTMEASKDRSDYSYRSWILFERVNDLTIEGGGTMDGNGEVWWRSSCKWNKKKPRSDAPAGVMFHGCQNLEVRNMTIKNSPQMQVIIGSCENVKAHNLTVSAPGNSPNTDGIHITHSKNVDVSNTIIGTGDDCISIVSGSSGISASDIRCGPGHGISIGSLGHGNSEAHVSDVTVTRARFFKSTNGVRIKTWQGGSGNVSNIKFRDIEMHNVRNPIIIDQNYCIDKNGCRDHESAVEVKDVLYENIKGTIDKGVGIMLDCSERHKCEGIVLQDIDLRRQERGDHATAVCNNVHFTALGNVSPHCPN